MIFLNLTPHAVNVNGLSIPPSGKVARIGQSREKVSSFLFDGTQIELYRSKFGQTVDLPEQAPDTFVIVSAMVRTANPNRLDLLSLVELQLDVAGQIVGCKNFDCNF